VIAEIRLLLSLRGDLNKDLPKSSKVSVDELHSRKIDVIGFLLR